MKAIPKCFPSTIPDRAVGLMHSVDDYFDMMIQMELEFPHKLDPDRLAKAIDLTLDAEPVLGCRWVPHWRKPWWERLDTGERRSFWPVNSKSEYEAFKSQKMDTSVGPQIKACLWQSPDRDYLLLKVAHGVADAAGVKDICGEISCIYGKLASDPGYRPEPNIGGSRGIWQVLRHIPLYAYPRILLNYWQETRCISNAKHGTYGLPVAGDPHGSLEFAYRSLSADAVSHLNGYGKARGATLNDVLLAAFIRALGLRGDWNGRSRFLVIITVDLRQRYLPGRRAKGITNLASNEYLDFGSTMDRDFDATLQRVVDRTQRRKASWIGVHSWLTGLPYLLLVPHGWMSRAYRSLIMRAAAKNNVPLDFTNGGSIDPECVTFDHKPTSARLLAPSAYPPHLIVGLSGYAGTLTFSAGTYSSQKEVVDGFFDRLIYELPK